MPLVGLQCHFVVVCRGSSSWCRWLVCSVILLSCAGALPPGAVGWSAVTFCCRVPGLFLAVPLVGMQCHFVVMCWGSSSRCRWLVCSVILLSCAGALPRGAVGWSAVSFCCRVPWLFLAVPLVGLQCHFVVVCQGSSSRCRWLVCSVFLLPSAGALTRGAVGWSAVSFFCCVPGLFLAVPLVGLQCLFVAVCRGSSSRCLRLVCSVILLSCVGALPCGAVGWSAVSFSCRVPGLFLPVPLVGLQCHFVVVCRGPSSRCRWLVCSVIFLSCAGALPRGAVGWSAVYFCCHVAGLRYFYCLLIVLWLLVFCASSPRCQGLACSV